jgi:hypothetical protein
MRSSSSKGVQRAGKIPLQLSMAVVVASSGGPRMFEAQ